MRYFAKIDESGKVLSVCFFEGENPTEVEHLLSLGFVEVTEEEYEKLARRMLEEREPEPTAPEPTQLDRIEAQTMYTALMTDTLLEEGV